MSTEQIRIALREAHTQHLLNQLQNEAHWLAMMEAASRSLTDIPVGKLVNAASLTDVVDQWLAQVTAGQGLEPVIQEITLAVWKAAEKDDTPISALFSEQRFEDALEQVLTLQSLREKAIHAAMSHPLVSEMVSEMLYTGIKNFLLEENALAKLPGVSSVMKMGRKSVVGKAMGGMEENIRSYLQKNIRVTLKTGEQWLNKQLTNTRIEQLARDGYQRIAPLKPATYLKQVPHSTVQEIVSQSVVISDESCQLEYTRQLVRVGIESAIAALSAMPLATLLENIQLPEEKFHALFAPAMAKGATVLVEQGALTPFIEWALDDFYQSDAFTAALES